MSTDNSTFISETVKILQDQRNSALDALAQRTVELNMATSKLKATEEHLRKLIDSINSSKESNEKLDKDLNLQIDLTAKLQKEFNSLQESYNDLLAKMNSRKSRTKNVTQT